MLNEQNYVGNEIENQVLNSPVFVRLDVILEIKAIFTFSHYLT